MQEGFSCNILLAVDATGANGYHLKSKQELTKTIRLVDFETALLS